MPVVFLINCNHRPTSNDCITILYSGGSGSIPPARQFFVPFLHIPTISELGIRPTAGVHKFLRVYEPPQNSGRQKGSMKQVPRWGPTNIRCHRTKLGLDSSVGIATRYGLHRPEIESRWGGQDFLYTSRPALSPTQPPTQWVPDHSRE